jgi:hypothetical protein
MACFGEVGEKTAGEAGDHGGHVGGDGVDLAWEAVKLRFLRIVGVKMMGVKMVGVKIVVAAAVVLQEQQERSLFHRSE